MNANGEGEKMSSLTSGQPCHHFSLADIQSATNDFDDELVIGHGGYGKVYRGKISFEESAHFVAIKRLDSMSNQGADEFKAEIEMLTKLRHCNLVSLIGFCDDNKEMILVYAYMPHGTLYDHLHEATTPLSWQQRLKIAIGAGRGLDYLHTGFGIQHGVIHRDVKSSNILLDENWAAMISDFGLSKVGPLDQTLNNISVSVKGTFGYLDPEYFYTRKLTRKTDVYAFGVVLFELLSGMLAVDTRLAKEQCSLAIWAQKSVKEGKLDQMVDSNIKGTIYPKCLRGYAECASRCLHRNFQKRPTMAQVVAKLQDLLELQEKIDKFAVSSGTMGFTWKIYKYLASSTKQYSDHGGATLSKSDEGDNGEMLHQFGKILDLKMFTYTELKSATMDFKNDTVLGISSYTKGWVDKTTYSPCTNKNGLPIAVKKVDSYTPIDLKMVKEFRHPNLVKLIGYCLNGKQLLIVYEFIHNRNFEDLLLSGAITNITLASKVKIVTGIALGILYMHEMKYGFNRVSNWGEPYPGWQVTRCTMPLDTHTILLDEDFTAKFSDYDITNLVDSDYDNNRTPQDRGDFYDITNLVDSDYDNNRTPQDRGDFYPGFSPSEVTLKSKIASGFTMVFTEVLTGRKINDTEEFHQIDHWWYKYGKQSLCITAQSCFEICHCDKVDSESRILEILKKYETCMHLTLKTHESCIQ